ncbi:MAG: penicillin-binding transpeptidase domain-containing protein [Propionibacteriaceae bacterium]|nr:penicillin-binding transpeptidase domain-containing protein [Propionibacteriaceae bacterium]
MRTFLLATLLGCLLASVGCTPGDSSPTGAPHNLPPAQQIVEQLAAGLSELDVSQVPFVNSAADAQADLKEITAGLGEIRPQVSAGDITYDLEGQGATAILRYHYPFRDEGWTYLAQASLHVVGGDWRVRWSPALVHPKLDDTTRLKYTRTRATRAPINGPDGLAIVEETPVVRIGLDKANLPADQQDASAKALAAAVGIDAEGYVRKVKASGPRAFVVAKTVRDGQVPPAVTEVNGFYLQNATAMMGPTDSFAVGLLGVTGEATAEIIQKSGGTIKEGDVVGLSGIQQRNDEQLRGLPGHTIEAELRPRPEPSPSPAAPTPSGSASPSPAEPPGILFDQPPVQGKPVELTLNVDMQEKAERVLADQEGIAAIVVLKASTGEVLAAANSGAAGVNAFATTGQYPPGSTFKVVSALALLRKGLTPDSTVECTPRYTVAGQTFVNYDGYPSSGLGKVPLSKAFAQSCNTSFMHAGEQVSAAEQASAAASLGFGIDHKPGFPSFYGSIPVDDNRIAKAASFIGQGQVSASPMSMAAVAASVASGKTVIPWVIKGVTPTPTAPPLSADEAATLRSLMAGVVDGGTASALRGVVDGAKTGTAQFGSAPPYSHHAWLIAWSGDLAVAAFVYEGVSGSASAAPLVKNLLAS